MANDNEKEKNKNTEKKEDRRAYRRKRRIRNQILAYVVLILLVAAVVLGGIQLIHMLAGKWSGQAGNETQTDPVAQTEETATPAEEPGVISTPDPVEDFTEPEPTEAEPEEPALDPALQALLDGMTIEQKVDGLFIVSPEALTNVERATKAGDGTKAALGQYAVGGILYSTNNVTGADQFKDMISTTKDMYRELYSRNVLCKVREEGALNTVAGNTTKVEAASSASEIGESGNRENASEAFQTIGNYLSEYGIDVDLASIAAVKTEENSYLKDRCYSDDADIAASMTGAAVEGMLSTGTMPCLAAFPGEGGLSTNPDKGAGSTDKSMEDLQACEYLPFRSGIEAGVPMVMVSAMQVPASGEDLPCMLSEAMITQELRSELGFEGVVITAPLEQIPSSAGIDCGSAAIQALQAGADMIVVYKHDHYEEAREALLAAVNDGSLTEERINESLIRIYTMELDRM